MKRHQDKTRGTLEISAKPPKTDEEAGGPAAAARGSVAKKGGGAVAAAEQAQLATKVFDFNKEAMLITDGEVKILHVNRAFTDITGYSRDDVLGKKPVFLTSGAHDETFYQDMWAKLGEQGYWQGEVWDRRKNGAVFPAWLTISTVAENGSVLNYIGCLSDITEKKRSEARAQYLNLHDALTGLPNKGVFLDRLSWSIASAHRHRQRLGVLALSLDGPQPMGSDVWDIILKQAASRLVSLVRESDAVARFDEDELVVLLDDLSSIHHAEWVAKKILWTLRQPFTAIDPETRMDASIGIALFPQHDADATGLVSKAERAMHQVRGGNKNAFQIFSHEIFSYIG
jgi:PAS domain S-box-containing protein/diguanylate cyclase (GGDEF)-like protein